MPRYFFLPCDCPSNTQGDFLRKERGLEAQRLNGSGGGYGRKSVFLLAPLSA
jgi:hypothetical protein